MTDNARSGDVASLAATFAAEHGADALALNVVESRLTGAFLTPEAAAVGATLAREDERARREQAAARVAEIKRSSGRSLALEIATGEAVATLLNRSRTADLLVLGQPDPTAPDGTPPGAVAPLLLRSGCPLLFVPAAGDFGRCGSRVLVAWSETRESARALRDALPILRRAQVVEVMTFATAQADEPSPLDGVVAHLARHGVKATSTVRRSREPSLSEVMRPSWTPDAPIAEALLSHAADYSADLLVMGGYGHSRLWELALGGVTRTILQSMTVPVLMSH